MNHDDMEESDTQASIEEVEGQRPSSISISTRFCAEDSDVTLQSSDGVFFKVHRRNLAGEIVHMLEHSTVLDLLLQFMYPQPQPELSKVDFQILAPLAEAAEKFEVFPAMVVCRFQMQAAIPLHTVEVLNYSGRHHYPEILDDAAQYTIGMPIKDIVTALSPDIFAAWLQYQQGWLDVLSFASTTMSGYGHQRDSPHTYPLPPQVQAILAQTQGYHPWGGVHLPPLQSHVHHAPPPLPSLFPPPHQGQVQHGPPPPHPPHPAPGTALPQPPPSNPSPETHNPCVLWSVIWSNIMFRMAGKPGTLKNLDDVFGPSERDDTLPQTTQRRCDFCKRDVREWRARVEEQINQLPKLSSFFGVL